MFLLVSVRHVGSHPGGHQHGVSIQNAINLGKTFLQISRIRNILLTWILARNLVYLPPFISQIPDFIYWTVLIFILIYFEWRETENQQYVTVYFYDRSRNHHSAVEPRYNKGPGDWQNLFAITRFRYIEVRFVATGHAPVVTIGIELVFRK